MGIDEYAQFVDSCRKSKNGFTTSTVDIAISKLPEGEVKDYLRMKRAEVVDMLLTEYNAEEVKAVLREEAIEEGRAEGRAEGRTEGREEARTEMIGSLSPMVRNGRLTLQEAAQIVGISEDEFRESMEKLA